MKKLALLLLAVVILSGFTNIQPTHAENQIPRITSIQGPTSIALSN